MTAHKDSLVLATYTTNATAEGQRAKEALELNKDPWAIYWPFLPVNRWVPGNDAAITSTQALKLQKQERAMRMSRLALADQMHGQDQQRQRSAAATALESATSAASAATALLASLASAQQ